MVIQPLTLANKSLFDRYACHTATRLSSYAFGALYIWRNFFEFHWSVIDDRFCVFAKHGGDYFMPIMPMGSAPSEKAIRESYAFMIKENRNKQIARIENVPEERVSFFQQMGFRAVLKETEYFYETEALIQLRGNRYKSKRSAYNAFVKNYPSIMLKPYQPCYLADCLALYDSWQQERRAKYDEPIYQGMLDDSWHAHRTGLMTAAQLGLIGRVVYIDGELKGYIFGYPLNSKIFCILFEVTRLELKGLPQFIYREFCREQTDYQWINAMDDSGLENLKRVKLSYRPAGLISSYNVFLPCHLFPAPKL